MSWACTNIYWMMYTQEKELLWLWLCYLCANGYTTSKLLWQPSPYCYMRFGRCFAWDRAKANTFIEWGLARYLDQPEYYSRGAHQNVNIYGQIHPSQSAIHTQNRVKEICKYSYCTSLYPTWLAWKSRLPFCAILAPWRRDPHHGINRGVNLPYYSDIRPVLIYIYIYIYTYTYTFTMRILWAVPYCSNIRPVFISVCVCVYTCIIPVRIVPMLVSRSGTFIWNPKRSEMTICGCLRRLYFRINIADGMVISRSQM